MVLVVRQVDAKEIGDLGVDGGGFPEGPSDSVSVIADQDGGPPGRISADLGKTDSCRTRAASSIFLIDHFGLLKLKSSAVMSSGY